MSPDEIAQTIAVSYVLELSVRRTDSLREAIAAALTTERTARERMWCLACGTVSRDDECDCTKFAETEHLRRAVPYADALKDEWDKERTAREKAEAERDRMRQYIAEVHNKVRHELSAEIEAATDKAFRALSGTQILSLIRKQEPTS